MKIITTVGEMQAISREVRSLGKKIAFVPTMGYFHRGHVSLMEHARNYGDMVVVSLFVNPTQFGPNEDFERYPRDFERDCLLARDAGVDYLFYPSVSEMYPGGYRTDILASGISKKFDGAKRPGHFDGVVTVVARLFNAVQADFSIFGQKDYQQCLVIKEMARNLLFDTKIIVAPTVREPNGLAMSSRNVYLSPTEREEAAIINKTLNLAKEAINNGENRRENINALMVKSLENIHSLKIDYAVCADAETLEEPEIFAQGQNIVLLIAVFFGKTRLIDNLSLCIS